LYGGTPAFQELKKEKSKVILKSFFKVVIERIKFDMLREAVKVEGKKLYYIVSTLQGSMRNRCERVTLLRHMFFRNFHLLNGIYKKKYKDVMKDRSDQVNKKVIDEYGKIHLMFKKFNQAYS
jgi:hypothetical protein